MDVVEHVLIVAVHMFPIYAPESKPSAIPKYLMSDSDLSCLPCNLIKLALLS